MQDLFLIPPVDFGPVIALVRHIDHEALLYLAAAVTARFWHRHMWLIYLALALAMVLTPRQ